MSPSGEDSFSLTTGLAPFDVNGGLFSPRTVNWLGVSQRPESSVEAERAHFRGFFGARHGFRHPLPPSPDLNPLMAGLACGLQAIARNGTWFRLKLHLRVYRTLRKCARQGPPRHFAERAATLDSWLAHWIATEGALQQSFRQQLQSPMTLQVRLRARRGTLARATTPMADPLKVQVIWELYWILRAQHAYRLKMYWQQLLNLYARRRALLRDHASLDNKGVDFWQSEPQSLPAVDAAIFVLLLQEPKFRHAVGRDLKATELLRLANAHLTDGAWVGPADSPLGPQSSPTLLAFLRSPLLTEPQWLKARTWQVQPLLPALTWVPYTDTMTGNACSTRASYTGEHSLGSDSSAEASSSDRNFRFSDTELDVRMARRTLTERRRSSSLGLRRPPREVTSAARQPLLVGGRPLQEGEGGGCFANSGDRPLLPAISRCLPRPGRSGSGVIRRSIFSLQTPPLAYEQLFSKERAELTTIYPKRATPLPSLDPFAPGPSADLRHSGARRSLPPAPPRRC